ncbi:hypothetical protein N0V88_004762 [Collariella sp. IMI 366227]|nr:hypothetical protein N0V88_004762 [Collariella sp. IMI 366227]
MLDDPHEAFWLYTPSNGSVATLDSLVRGHYEDTRDRLGDSAVLKLYDVQGQELSPEHEINSNFMEVWYRVAKSENDGESWKLSHWRDKNDRPFGAPFRAAILHAIDTGAAVEEIRNMVRKIKDSWLCTWLSIDITPKRGYIVLRGMDREYIYYPYAQDVGQEKPVQEVVEYLETRVLQGSHKHHKSALAGRQGFVRLGHNGRLLNAWNTEATWGETYEFKITEDDAADIFVREESWLLEATEQCTLCIETKTLDEMPVKITSRCSHKVTVCRHCLEEWLCSCIKDGGGDKVKCPDCSEVLEYADVKFHATKEAFEQYDNLLLRTSLRGMEDFYFCLARGCGSGQLIPHADKCSTFKCHACRFQYCITHGIQHLGETCEQYMSTKDHQIQANQKSEDEIRKTSKACPQCKVPVSKHHGCNHITCICGHEWCYLCLGPYQPAAPHAIAVCHHERTCEEHAAHYFDMVEQQNRDLMRLARDLPLHRHHYHHHALPEFNPAPAQHAAPPPPDAATPGGGGVEAAAW